MQSTSLPSDITGPSPLVHFANHAVGILDTPFFIVKSFLDNMSVRYFDVSTSWNPSSAKLKT